MNTVLNNTILSDKELEFKNGYLGNISKGTIETTDADIPDILKNYSYPVSAWPVIITPELANELETLSLTLPRLLRKIPSLYFANNIKNIADFYFNGNTVAANYALMCHNKEIEVGCRLDLTLTKDGFKVLEVNIGSSIGGWQVHSFEHIIKAMHSSLNGNNSHNKYVSINTQQIYIEFLIEVIRRQTSTVKDEINIFIDVDEETDAITRRNITIFFDNIFNKKALDNHLIGKTYVGCYTDLSIAKTGEVMMQEKVINGIITFRSSGIDKLSIFLMKPFITNKVYFPDNIGLALSKNKSTLAFLRELAEQNKFSCEENKIIMKHIPWTSVVRNSNIVYDNIDYNLPVLLRSNKDLFVIKSATGFQGEKVFIGKFLDDASWINVVDMALKTKGFIAQEFSDSLDFMAPDHCNAWISHKLIWGAFGFGEKYGGVWVRMSTVKNNLGVINSATGAVEAIVFQSK